MLGRLLAILYEDASTDTPNAMPMTQVRMKPVTRETMMRPVMRLAERPTLS